MPQDVFKRYFFVLSTVSTDDNAAEQTACLKRMLTNLMPLACLAPVQLSEYEDFFLVMVEVELETVKDMAKACVGHTRAEQHYLDRVAVLQRALPQIKEMLERHQRNRLLEEAQL